MKIQSVLSVVVLSGLSSVASAQLVGPGDIAFTGLNCDGTDNIAFAALVNIPVGSVISFTDNEWNGSGWADSNENGWTWTATSAVPAGAIVTIDNVQGVIAGTTTSNFGSIARIVAAGSNPGIGNNDEAIWAFLGAYASPSAFLTVMGNDLLAGTATTLANTGLVENETAFFIPGDEDIMAYTGLRDNQTSFAAYRSQIYTGASWVTQDAGGDQSNDGIFPDVPFSGQAFVIPTPGAAALLGLGGLMAGRRRR
jgi:hypothetical protein